MQIYHCQLLGFLVVYSIMYASVEKRILFILKEQQILSY